MVDARDGLRLHRLAGRKTYVLDKVRPRATRWRIMPKGAKSVVSFRQSGRAGWTKWTAFAGAAEFTAGNKPLTLRLPGSGTAQYRGALRSVEKAHGQRAAAGPLRAGRRPARGPGRVAGRRGARPGGRGAQLCGVRAGERDRYYDICDTTSCQVYGGFDAEQPASNAAVKKTRGRVVTYQGAAGVHAVLLEQRRLELGRLAALPGGPAGPLRGVVRQPQRQLDDHASPARRSRRRGRRSAR